MAGMSARLGASLCIPLWRLSPWDDLVGEDMLLNYFTLSKNDILRLHRKVKLWRSCLPFMSLRNRTRRKSNCSLHSKDLSINKGY